MNSAVHESIDLTGEELVILTELLGSERAKLLIEIRHTDHRAFRDELRHRLTLVEDLVGRCAKTPQRRRGSARHPGIRLRSERSAG